jgi:hypothetical protein
MLVASRNSSSDEPVSKRHRLPRDLRSTGWAGPSLMPNAAEASAWVISLQGSGKTAMLRAGCVTSERGEPVLAVCVPVQAGSIARDNPAIMTGTVCIRRHVHFWPLSVVVWRTRSCLMRRNFKWSRRLCISHLGDSCAPPALKLGAHSRSRCPSVIVGAEGSGDVGFWAGARAAFYVSW